MLTIQKLIIKIDNIKSIKPNISLLSDKLNVPPTVAANNKRNNASVESTPDILAITTDMPFSFSTKIESNTKICLAIDPVFHSSSLRDDWRAARRWKSTSVKIRKWYFSCGEVSRCGRQGEKSRRHFGK